MKISINNIQSVKLFISDFMPVSYLDLSIIQVTVNPAAVVVMPIRETTSALLVRR
jgi:hypothetical protein